MTFTEWRRVRYNAMRLMLHDKIPKKQALVLLEIVWPLNEEIHCECGERPPWRRRDRRGHWVDGNPKPLVWFNCHGTQCPAAGGKPARLKVVA
jgi:hypothetical protein